MTVHILTGDSRTLLNVLPEAFAQCAVTSPPYFGQRDYGMPDQIGQEKTPELYVGELVAVFRALRRVLRRDATLWLNLGDTYGKHGLLMIPSRVALAMQADGWLLRSDVIWHKPNPMPENVKNRPTQSYEHVFLFSAHKSYYYDAQAIAEVATCQRVRGPALHADLLSTNGNSGLSRRPIAEQRNARNVWSIPTHSYAGAHSATMPPDLAAKCIKAGSRLGDSVLDPFSGSGTTGLMANRLGRHATLIDLNPLFSTLARQRIDDDRQQPTPVCA